MSLRDSVRDANSPGASHDSPDRWLRSTLASSERELWIVVVLAMLTDVVLTVQGRSLGLVEMNPVASQMIQSWGSIGLYGLKGIALALGVACRFAIPAGYRSLVPLGLAVPSVAAAILNTTLIFLVIL